MSSFGPVWFGNSAKQIFLRAGYFDGDSDRITDFSFCDKTFHLALAGSSGQGKSVTLDAMVVMAMMEYAPWSVRILQVDAKVLGAKKYGTRLATKHIEAVGATGDGDYVLSLLEYYLKEMTTLNSVFSAAGAENIEEFCEKTGLCFPRHIIVYDEIQAGMVLAKKNSSKIAEVLDTIGRQGRNTGYHLVLASQEVVSELTTALKNVTMRAAMGCYSDVSTQILGNDAAKNNMGKKGRMIYTDQVEDTTKKANRMVRVPYAPTSLLNKIGAELKQIGDQFNVQYPLSFFDAEKKLRFGKGDVTYKKWLAEREVSASTWRLGESAFVSDDISQSTKIEFNGLNIENVCFVGSNFTGLERLYLMARAYAELQVEQGCKVNHVVSIVDRRFGLEECDPSTFSKIVFTEQNFVSAKGVQLITEQIYLRKLLISIESQIGAGFDCSEEKDLLFDLVFGKGSEYDTPRNRSRFYYAFNFILTNEENFKDAFSISGLIDLEADSLPRPTFTTQDEEVMDDSEREEYSRKKEEYQKAVKQWEQDNQLAMPITVLAKKLVVLATSLGCSDCAVKAKDFVPLYGWIVGIDKMIGLGIDNNYTITTYLKNALIDSSEYNVRVFLFLQNFEELTDILAGIGYMVSDSANDRLMSKFKVDNFPDMGGAKGLDVLTALKVDSEPKHFKFKKTYFDNEN